MASAEEVAAALTEAFPDQASVREIPVGAMDAVLRPFSPITFETERQIRLLLLRQDCGSLSMRAGNWMEAEAVTSGTGPEVERRIQFLLQDTCSCVLEFLPQAIRHAQAPVDPRVLALVSANS